MWPLGWGQFWPQGYNLNNFGNGPSGEATYQISKTWAFWFQIRFLKVFLYKVLYITCDPQGGANFDHRAIIWTIFVEVH